MTWPLNQDYNEAIQNPSSCLSDPELRAGEVVCNAMGLPRPCSGNFADVYEVRCPGGGRYAVKCFTREVRGLHARYQAISAHLRQVKLLFTVDFSYLEKGIRIKGDWYPILKMQWVEGLTLNNFVRERLDQPAMLESLLHVWSRMAKRLREAHVAHADLQHGNVLLVPGRTASSLAVKLIDYDGMFVPALAGKKSGEVGHPAYQHPQRLREGTYNLEVDRFPLLVVAASLRCLIVAGRSLWERYDTGDNLLFREEDLRHPEQSALFAQLRTLRDPLAVALVNRLAQAVPRPLEQAPLLEELLPDKKPTSRAAVAVGKRNSAVTEKTPAGAAQPAATDPTWGRLATTEPSAGLRRKRSPGGALALLALGGSVAALALVGLLVWGLSSSTPNKPTGPALTQTPPPAGDREKDKGKDKDKAREKEPSAAPQPGFVRVESADRGFEVVVDRTGLRIQASTGALNPVPAGEHSIEVRRGDFTSPTYKVVVEKGKIVTLKIDEVQGKGQVLADGRPLGVFDRPVELPRPVLVRWPAEALTQGRIPAPDLARLTPLWRESFDDPRSGWYQGKDQEVDIGYQDGNYHIRVVPGGRGRYTDAPRGGWADFACEVVGRIQEPPTGGWKLALVTDQPIQNRGVGIIVNSAGQLTLEAYEHDPEKGRGPKVGPFLHPAVKKAGRANALLVVARGRQLEVYVNGRAVCDPVLVDRDFTPARLVLGAFSEGKGANVELERITVWPLQGVATQQELLARILSTAPQELSLGDFAPGLAVKEFLKGERLTRLEKGTVYVVELWATWCPPCRTSIPHLTELQKKHKNAVFLGVSIAERDPAAVKPFVEQMGDQMAYRVAVDDQNRMMKTWFQAAGMKGIPSAFIINQEGRVAWIGHPMQMDRPLEEILACKYDLEAAIAGSRK
jgi:thiol-disulfide isomerase/thioredoxin